MTGRTPKPWYRRSRNTWCVVIDGKRVTLGPDKVEAYRKFHELMSGSSEKPHPPVARATTPEPPSPGETFAEVARLYLTHLRTRSTTRTPVVTGHYFKVFLRAFGGRPVSTLRTTDVTDAIAAHGKWNPTSANIACSRLMTALNWAVSEKLIPSNPVATLKKPPSRSRGADVVIDPDTARRMIEASPPFLADVLVALRDTGCRPGEVLSVTAGDYNRAAGVWLLRRHKTAHRDGVVRVVHLTPAVVAICDRLVKAHPSGPLFRTLKGRPFTCQAYLPKLMHKLREKLGLPRAVVAYSFRHTLATDALTAGVPDALVAELLGNSVPMVQRHYSHVSAKAAALREALKRARGG